MSNQEALKVLCRVIIMPGDTAVQDAVDWAILALEAAVTRDCAPNAIQLAYRWREPNRKGKRNTARCKCAAELIRLLEGKP